MYNSGITVKELIEDLKSEVDIAIEIPNKTYVSWLNSLEQLLYSEVVKEQKEYNIASTEIPIDDIRYDEDSDKARFEDIHAVFAHDSQKEIQLKKSTLTSGEIFPNCYYQKDGSLICNANFTPEGMRIVYFVRPELKTAENMAKQFVMFPIEFIDLAKAKLRGEAYKLANEDNLAAKWLNDYNVMLEVFKTWIADKSPNFGL